MFSGIFPSRFRQALRPSVFVRRKNFAKVRRKFVTSKFFFNFFLQSVFVARSHSAAAACGRRAFAARRPEARLLPESECKGMHFLFTHQIFLQLFSEKFRQNILKNPQNPRQPTATHPITPHQKKFTPQRDFHTPPCTTTPKNQRIDAQPPLNPHSTPSNKQNIWSYLIFPSVGAMKYNL